MTTVEQLDTIKAKFASYGRTIGSGERAEFNRLIDELRAVLVGAPPPTPNLAPVVIAGPDQTISLPAVLNLGGSVTDDGLPTGAGLTKVWSQTSGPGQAVFTPVTASFPVPGTYVLRLTANDSSMSAFDELTVTVRPAGVPPPSTGAKALLQPSDFTYLGYRDIQVNGSGTSYSQGLTHRYVNGDLRFLIHSHPGLLQEFSIAGKAFGSAVTAETNRWTNIGGLITFHGLWWEEAKQRLWTTSGSDYTNVVRPTQICTRSLPAAGGSVTNFHGPMSLPGVAAKRVFGGAQPVPAWFQTKYGVGPYVVGWGGYTSLVMQGGGASLGPTMYAVPDPANYPDNTTVPTGAFQTIMDHAFASDHRGSRRTIPLNYFDGGDPRPNPSTPPTVPPAATARWLSPAPDGTGWWVWGDSYGNTGAWIETPTKHGFVLTATLMGGKAYYMSSALSAEARVFERHIFDPTALGLAAQGGVMAWGTKPASMTQVTLPGNWLPNTQSEVRVGATYDATTQKYYVIAYSNTAAVVVVRLYEFQVAQ